MSPGAFGPYLVESVLASGGMSVIYRARHADGGEAVALKTVPGLSAPELAALRREIAVLASLRHPRIARVIAHGLGDGVPWLALGLVEGAPLSSLRRPRRYAVHRGDSAASTDPDAPTAASLPVTRVLSDGVEDVQARAMVAEVDGTALPLDQLGPVADVLAKLCDPLAFLHGEGIVHGDLKPENVVLGEDGPVLVDFGLARQFEGRLSLDSMGPAHAAGTLPYMAPEIILGDDVDARADLYALGCILFELVAGRPPFVGPARAVVDAHVSTPPPALRLLAPDHPAALYELVDVLLAKAPRDRIGYAEDVARALAPLGATAAPVSARPYLYRPRLAGRRAMLDALVAGASTDGLTLVAGESGVGKTRLLDELIRRASARGVRCFAGECSPGGERLAPLRAVIGHVADLSRTDPVEGERLLADRGPILATHFRSIQELASWPDPPPASPAEGRARLAAAILSTLSAAAAGSRLLLVIDDAQWADELVFELLDAVATAPPPALRVLAAFRKEERGPELERLAARVGALALDRLDERDVAQIVADMLALPTADASGSSGALPPELARSLAAPSEGNPFFVGEYLRLAVAEGVLVRDARRWRASGAARATPLPIPGSLRELVSRRLVGLSPDAERVLAAACVLGRDLDSSALYALSRLDEASAARATAELVRRDVLEEGKTLRFAHDKLRETAEGRLDEDLRRELHGQAADLPMLDLRARARHAHLGERWDDAWKLSFEVARDARAKFASLEAHAAAKEALAALERLPRSPDRDRATVDAATSDAFESSYVAAPRELLDRIERVEPIAVELADPLRLARTWSAMGRLFWQLADPKSALERYGRALALRVGVEEVPIAMAHASIGRLHALQGWFGRALPLLEASTPTFERAGEWKEWVSNVAHVSACRAARGHYDAALADAHRALSRAIALEAPPLVSTSRMFMVFVHWLGGEHEAMRDECREVLRLAPATGNRLSEYFGYGYLAWAESRLGRHADARAALVEHRRVADDLGGRLFAMDWFAAAAAEIAHAAGDHAEAFALAERAAGLGKQVGGVFSIGHAERTAGLVLAARGDVGAAARFDASRAAFLDGDCPVEAARTDRAAALALGDAGERLERALRFFEEVGLAREVERTRVLL